MTNKAKVKMDALGVIRLFGGRDAIVEFHKELGLPSVTETQVNKWGSRKMIPTDHLLCLMLIARKRKIDFDPLIFARMVRTQIKERNLERRTQQSAA